MTRLLAMLGSEGLCVWLAHHLSAPHRARVGAEWAMTAGLSEMLVTLLHVLAWVMTWWLLAGTLHDVVLASIDLRRGAIAGRAGLPTPRRVAPLWVQRIVNQAMGTLLVLGVMAGPAAAVTQNGPVVGTQQVVTPPGPIAAPNSPEPPPTAEPLVPPTADPGETPAAVDPAGGPAPQVEDVDPVDEPASDTHQHVVALGENLWVIARAALTADGDAPPSDRDVHRYWLRLIDANTFSSGSPDLIHPAEVLMLPDIDATSPSQMSPSQMSSSKAPMEASR